MMFNSKLTSLIILILPLLMSCNDQNENKPRNEGGKEKINLQAPFYTRQLPEGSPRISKNYDSSKVESFFPFILYKDGSYMVAAEIDGLKLDSTYRPIFQKYNYDGTGYNWSALIKVILRSENPELEKHLSFDPEGGGFYLFADSEKSQRQFAIAMSKIFNDTSKIDKYLKSADPKTFEE